MTPPTPPTPKAPPTPPTPPDKRPDRHYNFGRMNMAFAVWMYWEGYKANITASAARQRRKPLELLCLMVCIPIFSLLEGLGGIRGFLRLVTRTENEFVVIAKPV